MRAEAPAQGALRGSGSGSVHGEGGADEELSGSGRGSREDAAFAGECARGAVEERAGGGRLLVVMMGERRRVVLSWRDVVKSFGSSIEHLESFQRSGLAGARGSGRAP